MRNIIYAALFFCFAQASHAQEIYVVQSGDTIGSIAEEQLGNISASSIICALNELDDCDHIRAGQVLLLARQEPPDGELALTSFSEIYALESELGLTFNPQGPISVVETDTGAILSGHQPNAQSVLRTDGAFIRVTDEFEQAASGNMIRIEISASGPEGGSFAVAYSTAEVGNSGWQIFEIGPEPVVVSYEYDVRPMVNGNGDFLGILPDPEGTGQSITISKIRLMVLGD